MKDTSSVPGDTSFDFLFIFLCREILEEEKKIGSSNRFAETNFETPELPVCLRLSVVLYPIPRCQLLIKNV